MQNQIRIGLFVFSLFIFQIITTYATDYNYLPNDVFIKQQEERSALEYRLKTLENQYPSNPQASILSIEQRISQLRSEWETEKSYITQRLAQLGALTTSGESPVLLKRIDDKYQSQIDSLNQQKSSYQSQVSNQQQKDQEIERLRKELLEIIDKQADTERQRILDELKEKQQKLEEEQRAKNTTYYSDDEILKVFNYLDSLSLKEASAVYRVIQKDNKNVAERVATLYNKKYPNGKTETSINADNKKSIKEVAVPEVKKETPVIKTVKPAVKQEIKKTQVKDTTTEEKVAHQIKQEQPKIELPQAEAQKLVEKKVTVREKISGFFKKVFWK